MRKPLKRQKVHTGRVMRDFRRHLQDFPRRSLRARITARLALVWQVLHQQPKRPDKIYALQESGVDCIAGGKARVWCESGCKLSVATTLDEDFVDGMRSFPGNPCDGHILREALELITLLTDQPPRSGHPRPRLLRTRR